MVPRAQCNSACYAIGDKVDVWSQSRKQWLRGAIAQIGTVEGSQELSEGGHLRAGWSVVNAKTILRPATTPSDDESALSCGSPSVNQELVFDASAAIEEAPPSNAASSSAPGGAEAQEEAHKTIGPEHEAAQLGSTDPVRADDLATLTPFEDVPLPAAAPVDAKPRQSFMVDVEPVVGSDVC